MLASMRVSTILPGHALFYRGSQVDKFLLLCREAQVLKVLEGIQYEQTGRLDLLFVSDLSSLVGSEVSGNLQTITISRARVLATVQSTIGHFAAHGTHEKNAYTGFSLSCPASAADDCTFSVILQPGPTLRAARASLEFLGPGKEAMYEETLTNPAAKVANSGWNLLFGEALIGITLQNMPSLKTLISSQSIALPFSISRPATHTASLQLIAPTHFSCAIFILFLKYKAHFGLENVVSMDFAPFDDPNSALITVKYTGTNAPNIEPLNALLQLSSLARLSPLLCNWKIFGFEGAAQKVIQQSLMAVASKEMITFYREAEEATGQIIFNAHALSVPVTSLLLKLVSQFIFSGKRCEGLEHLTRITIDRSSGTVTFQFDPALQEAGLTMTKRFLYFLLSTIDGLVSRPQTLIDGKLVRDDDGPEMYEYTISKMRPAELKQVGMGQVEMKQAETKPAELMQAETKPAESMQAETKPTESMQAEVELEEGVDDAVGQTTIPQSHAMGLSAGTMLPLSGEPSTRTVPKKSMDMCDPLADPMPLPSDVGHTGTTPVTVPVIEPVTVLVSEPPVAGIKIRPPFRLGDPKRSKAQMPGKKSAAKPASRPPARDCNLLPMSMDAWYEDHEYTELVHSPRDSPLYLLKEPVVFWAYQELLESVLDVKSHALVFEPYDSIDSIEAFYDNYNGSVIETLKHQAGHCSVGVFRKSHPPLETQGRMLKTLKVSDNFPDLHLLNDLIQVAFMLFLDQSAPWFESLWGIYVNPIDANFFQLEAWWNPEMSIEASGAFCAAFSKEVGELVEVSGEGDEWGLELSIQPS